MKDEGVGESALKSAAARLGLQAHFVSRRQLDPDGALADLENCASKARVALVSWHDDDENHFHWVCVPGFTRTGDVIVFDPSEMDDDVSSRTYRSLHGSSRHVGGVMSRARFRNWITPELGVDPNGDDPHFFIELWPTADAKQRFVPGAPDDELLARMRRRPVLLERFDTFIDDLRDIFGPPSAGPGIDACDFLQKRRARLVSMVAAWTDREAVDRKVVEAEIEDLVALTRCYRFRVPARGEDDVLASLGFYLGWRACEEAYELERA
jgi:hypothetical protein